MVTVVLFCKKCHVYRKRLGTAFHLGIDIDTKESESGEVYLPMIANVSPTPRPVRLKLSNVLPYSLPPSFNGT
jgi:hypothetical protein